MNALYEQISENTQDNSLNQSDTKRLKILSKIPKSQNYKIYSKANVNKAEII